MMDGSGGSGGGSGGGPQGSDPDINVSGGAIAGGGSGTNNSIAGTVPIGTYFTGTASAPPNLTFASVAWSGLGGVGGYIPSSTQGGDAPPASMTTIPAPVLNQTPTNFLVVTPQNNYKVSVTVTYQGVAGDFTSAVSFTSGQIPTYTYLGQVRSIMNQPVAAPAPTISNNGSQLWFVNSGGDGMGIEAQTSTQFPGQYALMQLITPLRQYTDGVNTYQLSNSGQNPQNLQMFDNGGPTDGGTGNTLGMAVFPVNGPAVNSNQWTQDNQTSQDFVTLDAVNQAVPSAQTAPPAPTVPTQVSVGGLNGNGGNETYTTYLMYKPPSNIIGEWVAIGQVTWGWGGTANVGNVNNNNLYVGQVLSPNTGQVNAQPLNAALPLWNTTTRAMVTAGWQKQ
jgi:hypothetical protein